MSDAFSPTLKQLRYLTTLHQTHHFGKAADICHVTQSTLSAGIRELETLLGTQLVERTRRAVRFTPLGERVVEKAFDIIREANTLVDIVQSSGKPLTSTVRMGVIPTIAPFFLPQALPKLRKQFPQLKLYLREDLSQVVCAGLARGELDVILLALPFHCGEVEEEILFEDPFFAAFPTAAADHFPAATIEAAALEREQLLLLEEGHCLKDHALAACQSASLKPDQSILGTSLHTLVQMVDNDLGVTLLPKLAIDGGILEGTDIGTKPLAGDAPARKIGLIWRKGSPRQAEFKVLAEALRDLAAV
ncbi:MAG: LysR substrate-binding domain-containing protein [Sphingomonadales bacterium]